MFDPIQLRRRMDRVNPPYVSVETIVSRGRRRKRLRRFGVAGGSAVVLALFWAAISPWHLGITRDPPPTSRIVNINQDDASPRSQQETVVARGTADGKAWRLVVSGSGNHHLCVQVKVATYSTGGCGLLSIDGPIKLDEGTIASVKGEFIFGVAGEAITRLELSQGGGRQNLPLHSAPSSAPGAKFFVRWLPKLSSGSVIARGQNGSVLEGAQLQLQEQRLAALAARHFAGIHEALAFIREQGIHDAVLPTTLPKGTHLAPRHPVALSKQQGSLLSATLELRTDGTRMHLQFGTAVFDGCGADSARAIKIMGVPALINKAAGGGQVDTQLIWPATHAHPEGHFGIAGNISPEEAESLARSMIRVSASRSQSRVIGC